jgi:hypothetical protein
VLLRQQFPDESGKGWQHAAGTTWRRWNPVERSADCPHGFIRRAGPAFQAVGGDEAEVDGCLFRLPSFLRQQPPTEISPADQAPLRADEPIPFREHAFDGATA